MVGELGIYHVFGIVLQRDGAVVIHPAQGFQRRRTLLTHHVAVSNVVLNGGHTAFGIFGGDGYALRRFKEQTKGDFVE